MAVNPPDQLRPAGSVRVAVVLALDAAFEVVPVSVYATKRSTTALIPLTSRWATHQFSVPV